MKKSIASLIACAVMTGSAFATGDYVFPSTFNPGYPAVKNEDVPQYVVINWDDNAYTGKDMTTYEPMPGEVPWDKIGRVGGRGPQPWDGNNNPLNLQEGDMGTSWAVQTLGSKGGNSVKMTFSYITGLFLPTTGSGWDDLESELGYWVPTSEDGIPHKRVAVSWGREMEQTINGTQNQPSWMIPMAQEMSRDGHEVACHTLDHFESNSPLPGGDSKFADRGFGKWNNEGFATQDENPFYCRETGELIKMVSQSREFGSKGTALKQGWIPYAGRQISKEAWKGQLELSQWSMDKYIDHSVKRGNVFGFRAPRLEINSCGLFALAEMGYTYDCSIEEGWESHRRDGTNFQWPYTTHNGSSNVWTQKNRGARVFFDSFPQNGFWQMPVQVVIVPPEIREDVWENANKIAQATGSSIADKAWWVQNDGKITGFDFNQLILWGMTHQNWEKTLKYNLDQRMAGNRSPFLIGAHTDYFTPMYDNATLLSDWNKDGWGLPAANEWNTWDTRIKAMENFVDYGLQKGVKYVSSIMLIEEMRKLADQARRAVPTSGPSVSFDDVKFTYIEAPELPHNVSVETFTGSVQNARVTIPAPNGGAYPYGNYAVWWEAGAVKSLDYISLDYKTNVALRVHLLTEGGEATRSVLLNNVKTGDFVKSGYIPLHAFEVAEHSSPEVVAENQNRLIDLSKVTGISIEPLAPSNGFDYNTRTSAVEAEFSLRNIKVVGEIELDKQVEVSLVDGATAVATELAVTSFANNALQLQVPAAGRYNVQVITPSGRIVHSVENRALTAGVNALQYNPLAEGVYMIRVTGVDGINHSITQKAMIRNVGPVAPVNHFVNRDVVQDR